jgi:hypothetical protein
VFQRLFVRRGNYAVARLDRLSIQVWYDRPQKSGMVPIRVVINHPDLHDPDDPSGSGLQFSVKPTSPSRPNGTNKSYRNLAAMMSRLGIEPPMAA